MLETRCIVTLRFMCDSNIWYFIFYTVKGIQDCRTDDNIGYVGGDDGIRGLEKKVYQEGASVAIACFPVHIDEVFDIADNNQIMTPKYRLNFIKDLHG